MATRLIDVATIRREKIARGRSWIYAEMKAGRFPEPAIRGRGPNLWNESDVDRWLAQFIEKNSQPGTSP